MGRKYDQTAVSGEQIDEVYIGSNREEVTGAQTIIT
jgi:hypothetical protein